MNFVDKLKSDTARYWDKPFLKASMAVCAMTALADGEVSLSERYRVDAILGAMDRLQVHNLAKAVEILDDYINALRTERETAGKVLEGKIARFSDDYKSARTLLRIAYLIVTTDGEAAESERAVFNQICATLNVASGEIWEKMAEAER